MTINPYDRKSFLFALVEYARESETFNPNFHLGEMLTRLDIDEKTFNILLHSLGKKYCRLLDIQNNEARYAINLSECLILKEQFEAAELKEIKDRERNNMDIAIQAFGGLSVIGGFVIGVLLNYNKQTSAVWTTFATVIFVGLAFCLGWQKSILSKKNQDNKKSSYGVWGAFAIIVLLDLVCCIYWQQSIGLKRSQDKKKIVQKDNKSTQVERVDKNTVSIKKNVGENTNQIYPKLNGNDVLVPHFLIENIKKKKNNINYVFDPSKPVYSAYDFNGWLVLGNSARSKLKYSAITKEGDYWIAKDMKNKRFHPVQIIDTTLDNPFFEKNIAWALIENYGSGWSNLPFVDMSEGSPCLCLGGECPQNK